MMTNGLLRACAFLLLASVLSVLSVGTARAEFTTDAGADLRIRQEMVQNVPGLPDGGIYNHTERGPFRNHLRFRARVWGEAAGDVADVGFFRLYLRLCDESRWTPEPRSNVRDFPDELMIDNLFLEGKGLLGDKLDFSIGRQDVYALYGLDHIFYDGTMNDGSQTCYAEVVRATWHVDDSSTIDVFGLYNFDDLDDRWGTERAKHRARVGADVSAEPEADDWGAGVVWGSRIGAGLSYQVYAMTKHVKPYHVGDDVVGEQHFELAGAKICPRLTSEWSLQFEGNGQLAKDASGDHHTGWSSYVGAEWRSDVKTGWRPFGSFGWHYMSGGAETYDPMWFRSVNDPEFSVYGSTYGLNWNSNQHYIKLTGGIEFDRHHSLMSFTGPMFVAENDGAGGGNGPFKGYLIAGRYEFPIWTPEKGERFEIYGHVYGEFFAPGDYYASSDPVWFFRWNIVVTF